MTSNIAESVNSLFGDEREIPIKAMFEKISEKYSIFLTKGVCSSSAQKKEPNLFSKLKRKYQRTSVWGIGYSLIK